MIFCFFVLVSLAVFDVIFELVEFTVETDTPEQLRCLFFASYVFFYSASNVVLLYT